MARLSSWNHKESKKIEDLEGKNLIQIMEERKVQQEALKKIMIKLNQGKNAN